MYRSGIASPSLLSDADRGRKVPSAVDLAVNLILDEASLDDLEALLALMRDYYAFDGHHYDPETARAAMAGLLADPSLGRVWIWRDADRVVGYLALTLGYSLELGGRDAFIDELFLDESYRGRGLGSRLLRLAIARAAELGVKAVHLEVAQGNEPAAALYRRLGFQPRPHGLLTLTPTLAAPTRASEARP